MSFFDKKNIEVPLVMIIMMWIVFLFEMITTIDLGFLGVNPRNMSGLIGVLTAPLVHGGLRHIISNTFPLLILGVTLFVFYHRIALWVFVSCYLFTGVLVWFFGRSVFHIGASGVVYAIAAFLISYGIFRKDFRSLAISIIIVSLYGGLVYGILPTRSYISWESHALGALVGVALAFVFKDTKKLD